MDVVAEPIALTKTSLLEIEREKLNLERYKAQLDYKKFVLGSVFVALAIAAIPPLFQLATAVLEYTKSNADRQAKQQAFRDDYIKEFVSNALNQDIELRIRFAQYFSRVSTEPYRQDWVTYLDDLRKTRNDIRGQIDKMEADLSVKSAAKQSDPVEIDRLFRNLNWSYNEVGYVAKNRSASVNPRVSDDFTPALLNNPLSLGRFADSVYFLTQPIAWAYRLRSAPPKYEPVQVPSGFVVTFDSTPRVLWLLLKQDGELLRASVIHDYLYWTQSRSREEADEIFKLALQDSLSDQARVNIIYQGARVSGQAAWDNYAKMKAQGERRVLKEFPDNPQAKWDDWKKRPNVFKD